jgi:hypothetical protein
MRESRASGKKWPLDDWLARARVGFHHLAGYGYSGNFVVNEHRVAADISAYRDHISRP